MAVDWETVPLDSLIEPGRGISYGIVQPGAAVSDGVPIVRVSDVRNGRIAVSDPLRVSPAIEAAYARTRLSGGELLMTLVGTVGETAVVPESMGGWNTARAVAVIPVCKEVGAYWVQVALRVPGVREIIDSRLNTTVQATLNLGDVAQLPIVLPPLREREAIAHILGTLDDKIELNRRMNGTLEAMTRALFNSWFVDFDPVRAKTEGRYPGSPMPLADLFPDSFEDSELGKIPKGWQVQRLGEIGGIVCGKTPSTQVSEYYGEDVPFITIPDMHGKIFATTVQRRLSGAGAKSQEKKMLPVGAICVSCIATAGLVVITSEMSQTNQQINSIIPIQKDATYFWYWSLRNLGDDIKAGGSGGSVLTNLSTGRFADLRVLASLECFRSAYSSLVTPMFDRILANERESHILVTLRDTLLPKLVSGEKRVKDAKRSIENVQ